MNRKILVHFLAFCLILTYTLPVNAALPDSSYQDWGQQPSFTQFLNMAWILLGVIILIWVTLSLMRKMMGQTLGKDGTMIIAGGLALGTKKSLQLVKINEKIYVIGITDHHISHITTIDNPDEVEIIMTNSNFYNIPSNTFSTILQKISGKTPTEKNTDD